MSEPDQDFGYLTMSSNAQIKMVEKRSWSISCTVLKTFRLSPQAVSPATNNLLAKTEYIQVMLLATRSLTAVKVS